MAKPSKAATTSSLYQAIVYIIVGPQKQKFSIHKNLLCHYSSYFNVSLNGSFKEAQKGSMELLNDDPVLFEIFKTWLYSKKLVKDCDGDEVICSASDLVRLHVLGDLRGISQLKTAVIDELVSLQKQCNTVPVIEIP
ncbi:BTB/POZ-like [Lasallia pustulata]|uniref:BTB/POZ-like n=1 Tax=Lasallia pustulata TaxID=136370 RepID=A0A1W5DCG8_9LECA|nr:BTB/POZ-like [Lasallia pustulata]